MALFTLVKCLVNWKNEIKTKLSQLMQRGKEGLYERLRRWSDQYRQDGRTGQVKVYHMKTGGSLLKPSTHSVLVLLQGTSILVDSQ